jgi:multiple sugar transport system permease protein
MAPFLVFVIALGAVPFAQVIRMSFSEVEIEGTTFAWKWNGLDNIERVLADPQAWQAIGNTLIFVIATTAGTLILGSILAILVDRGVAMLPIARNVLVWPAIIAPVIVSLMWLLLLSPTAGGINKLFRSLDWPLQQWLNEGFGAMTAVIVVDLWHWTPVVFLFVYTALKGIDEATLEAARVDGASEFVLLQRIVLPLLTPALAAVAMVRVVMGVKAFDEMYLLTSGGPNGATTLVSQHIRDLFFVSFRFGDASAFGFLIVVATALILGGFLFIRSRREAN